MDKKKIRNDIILIASLLLVAIISLIVILSTRTKAHLIAKVYVQNDIVETIDLSKKEEKDYTTLIGNYYYTEGCLRFIMNRRPNNTVRNVFKADRKSVV